MDFISFEKCFTTACLSATQHTQPISHTHTRARTHTLIQDRAHTLGYYGIVCMSLCSFFGVFSRCCRPWLHCCELCAHLSYGFIICCSLFNTRDFGSREKKNAMFSFINTHNQALYLLSLARRFFLTLYFHKRVRDREDRVSARARAQMCKYVENYSWCWFSLYDLFRTICTCWFAPLVALMDSAFIENFRFVYVCYSNRIMSQRSRERERKTDRIERERGKNGLEPHIKHKENSTTAPTTPRIKREWKRSVEKGR